mmetsp:Transcript_1580/g.1534  ORF Transcript_1580/g.1534 Transcript_1580/m.1534 type:complete len:151 (-) Transcript_1580:199-651(-)
MPTGISESYVGDQLQIEIDDSASTQLYYFKYTFELAALNYNEDVEIQIDLLGSCACHSITTENSVATQEYTVNTAAYDSDLFIFAVAFEDCAPTTLTLTASPATFPSYTLTHTEANNGGSTEITTHLNFATSDDTKEGTYTITIDIAIGS